MRTLPVAATALAAALALTLTACDSGGSGTGKNRKRSGSDSADSGNGSNGTGGGSAAGGSSARACKPGQFTQEVAANEAPAAGDTGNVSVTLTNTSNAGCTLNGFPEVGLTGGGGSWTVGREQSAQPEKLTVRPAEAATFTLTYVRGPKGDAQKGAAVQDAAFKLPGAGTELSFPWKFGEVALRAAGEPDATVTPFQRAGD
ncbi:DUF4232 domain-containing protein [Streptomyces fructofermentans]|uniref:DUF4232 domain-containing protein n=1 Tax=Streptomyces fructofermentans TaxID=152141 RepID=A0A918NEQ1_9ACTN|nr:DUF4232 domain-containing protein [Streptomyces fructofermentans]GGX64929.1 hypothetical protein GCM10010515_35720 [Streptomyces fructofermentans]